MKKEFIVFLLFISLNFYSQEKSTYYALVNSFKSKTEGKLSVFINEKETELKQGSRIEEGSTITTFDEQNLELFIYNNNKVISAVYLKENSDFKFYYDAPSNSQTFKMKFGGARIVSDESIITKVISQKAALTFTKADFGFVSLVDFEKNINKGQIIVFDKELIFKVGSSETQIKSFQNAMFEDEKLFDLKPSFLSELKSWKERSIFHINEFPKNLYFFLEAHNLDELPEKIKKQLADEAVVKEEKKKKYELGGLLSFELGGMTYNKEYGVRFAYNPWISLFDDTFKLGFYFPLNILPTKLTNYEIFFNVNNKNNEWSFGTDKPTIEEAVFDAFDDALLKINKVDYVFKDIFTINSGDFFEISDNSESALVNFNSHIFYPMQRKSSFAFKLTFPWLEAFLYAEDVLPKGLYGTSLSIMTPFKSFRVRYDISMYTDCYNLMQFDKNESLFPMQFSNALTFDIFNLPSFGFSLFFTGGVFLPFSYNYHTGASLSDSLFYENNYAAAANTSGSAGFLFRVKKTSIYGEFIYDSGLNKIGLFDTYYLAVRDAKYAQITEWMTDLKERDVIITDFNFGGRIRVKYNFTKYVDVETSYQVTGPKYFDKLYIKTSFDTQDKFKFRFVIFSEWAISGIVLSAMNLERFLLNNVFYVGYKMIFMPGFDLNFTFGVFPDYIYYKDFPHKSKMTAECYITIAPLIISSQSKKKNK